ncbi:MULTISPECIES: hypothetical protein [Paenibacillus]|uniref:Uncharacterized protein n=1 Tax=Paenibacillus odorifer TaxID=189426 RepID=A0A1R0X0Y8_9BACL|nr:hypothetical protein [Paenibacillus odorifer]OMD26236.1 hypothetical protein BJP51_27535 [Paenibacillus odorifer]OME28880.1 hypothetical protein BSK63_23500 [Paenibacillus odorifer]
MIRIQKVYDEIIKENGWSFEEKESKERNLRKKFSFLMTHVMLRDPESYFIDGANQVPEKEGPVIKNLLLAALDRKSIISKWFNGSYELTVSENVMILYAELKNILDNVYHNHLTDEVTKNDWVAAIDAATDYSNAHKVIRIKLLLEDLRNTAKPLNHTINFGDIIAMDNDGSKEYILRGKRDPIEITEETTIMSLLDNLAVENEYHDVLISLITKFEAHASARALEDIRTYALMKSINDDEDPKENTARKHLYSADSEYLHRFRNIYQFLKSNPDVVTEIENEVGTTGLLEFFNITIKGEK